MEFLVIAYDGTDEGALDRRMAVRDQHMAYIKGFREKGHVTHGGAVLDDAGKMIGSVILYQFETRQEMDDCLANDPYVIGKAWQNIKVSAYKTAPSFVENLKSLQPSV